MPYTLKPSKVFVKDPNSTGYLPQNVITEESTQEQLSQIQSAGTTQVNAINTQGNAKVAAIETKGEEVLESIPDDYSALSGEVSDLKSAVNDMGTVSVDGLRLTIGHMMDSGKWGQLSAGSYKHFVFPVSGGDVVKFECTVKDTVVAFVTDYQLPLTSATLVMYSAETGFTSKIAVTKETEYEWTTPSDAKYLIVEKVFGSADVGISVFNVNGYDYTKRLNDQIVEIQGEFDGISDTFEAKTELIQGISDALKYMHGASGITWVNGTIDSSGVLQPSERSIVSGYIDLHNRNLYVCLPEDGTITARTYYYSDTTESSFGVRGTAKTASSVSTNGTYRYCRLLLYYTASTTPRDDDLSKKAFLLFGYADNYRGKVGQLGVSAFSECTDEGYYSFVASDLANLSDAPADLTTGGILFSYSHFGSFTLYQTIYDTSGNKYVRYGTGRFIKTGSPQADLDILPTFEVGAITSSTGLNANSTKRVRMVSTEEIRGGFKLDIPSGMKAEIITYTSATIAEGNRGETSLGFLAEGSYLFYPRYGETHFRIYGGYTDDRTITDATVGSQFKMTYFDNAASPKWLALGDSITQGFYSYNNGSSDTFGRTLNCWAAIAANKANLRLVNYGVGGSGYVENGTVLDMKNAKDHVTGVDFSGFDCVTLAWGVNDWKGNQNVGSVDSVSGDGTICGNMKYVIETILASNPLIKIFVVTPLNCAGYSKNYGTKATNWGLGYSFTNSGTLENVYQAEKSVAEYYGLQLIDQTHQSAVNRENLLTALVDGVHPSMDCHAVLGAEMAGKVTFESQLAAAEVDVPVTDVQVNGTSVLENGVANIPKGSNDGHGVVRSNNSFGLVINSGGVMQTVKANDSALKAGTHQYDPVVPYSQHMATFYGLAKAAGDSTQSASSNAVGKYTDGAKDKIQVMLGLDALIGTHEGATASAAKAVGDVFIYNGKLYKATTAISSGAAIVPGTNCTQTTIIDLLRGA